MHDGNAPFATALQHNSCSERSRTSDDFVIITPQAAARGTVALPNEVQRAIPEFGFLSSCVDGFKSVSPSIGSLYAPAMAASPIHYWTELVKH